MSQNAPARTTALAAALPTPDVVTTHGRPVAAPVDVVAAALRATALDEAWLARVLLLVRTGGRQRGGDPRTIGDLEATPPPGAVRLPGGAREVAIGWVGRPWPGAEHVVRDAPHDAAGFAAYVPVDAVKVAFSLRCDAAAYGTLLVTETRIAVGPAAAQAFGRYWRVVHLGSGLVRRSLLRAVAAHAEAAA